jgi:hypothetical protein
VVLQVCINDLPPCMTCLLVAMMFLSGTTNGTSKKIQRKIQIPNPSQINDLVSSTIFSSMLFLIHLVIQTNHIMGYPMLSFFIFLFKCNRQGIIGYIY